MLIFNKYDLVRFVIFILGITYVICSGVTATHKPQHDIDNHLRLVYNKE